MRDVPSPTTTHSMSMYASIAEYWKAQAEANAQDAARYRTMLANLETLVLRTEKGSTLTLKASKRGEEITRRGTDATLDGLGAA